MLQYVKISLFLTVMFSVYISSISVECAGILDEVFFSAIAKTDPIERDAFLDENLNKIISGRAVIFAVDKEGRYNRTLRITAEVKFSGTMRILCLIYTDEEDYLKALNSGDLFEFKGQFVIYTPLTASRSSYLFDIILQEGALLVK